MNTNYARVNRDGDIVYAPTALPVSGGVKVGASAREYAAQGWLPVNRDWAPTEEPPDGYRWERTGLWQVDGGVITPVWGTRRVEDPAPRVFSKLKVVAALMEAGVWAQVKAWIEANGLYDLYLAAQEFAEDNEYFARGLSALKPVVGWTDGQVEALLAKCVKD